MKFANLVIDNSSDSTDRLYTYATGFEVFPGDRVRVPFGQGDKIYDAYVFSVGDEPDSEIKKYKTIICRDEEVSLPGDALAVASFMSERYFARYIDCLKCFAPAGQAPRRRQRAEVLLEDGNEYLTGPRLTAEQIPALAKLQTSMESGEHKVFLLHGITGSGKTEVYLKAIEHALASGKTAIILVPEISLTGQTIKRFQERLGRDKIAVLHSKLSPGERYDQWARLKKGEAKLAIGARSAVFAPLDNIGIIAIDEEHEATYKSDMTPKYDTVEVAIERARANGSLVLLGSATPSVISSYRARQSEYNLLSLKKRYNENPLPHIQIVDMREELKEGNRSIFSRLLFEKMNAILAKEQQVILFLNRRGHSTFISCRDCGFSLKCDECNISMTYHKGKDTAVCHYCGKKKTAPKTCPSCGSKNIRYFGAGTEKVEEITREYFPGYKVERLDLDTSRRKGSGEAILNRFEKGETQILVGTQLVAKGLDFSRVGLVGIVAADITLNIPDFRSAERTFQLITQAAGRSGRGDEPGEVVVQTYSPDHYSIIYGGAQDYEGFYKEEIAYREGTGYPPFADIIYLVISAKTEEEAEEAATKIRNTFLRWAGKAHAINVLGPKAAPMSKSAGWYRYQLFIKCPIEHEELYRGIIKRLKEKVYKEKQKEWLFSADINPFGFL